MSRRNGKRRGRRLRWRKAEDVGEAAPKLSAEIGGVGVVRTGEDRQSSQVR